MLPANLDREIEAAALIRNLQGRVRRLETLENQEGTAGCLTLIEDIVAGAGQDTITFSSIPQIHRHLLLLINAAAVEDSLPLPLELTYNGDGGANYRYYRRIESPGPADTETGGIAGNQTHVQLNIPAANNNESTDPNYCATEIKILDYIATNKFKPCIWQSWTYREQIGGEGPPTTTAIDQGGGHWQNQSAITSIGIEMGGVDFSANSQFTLYGLC